MSEGKSEARPAVKECLAVQNGWTAETPQREDGMEVVAGWQRRSVGSLFEVQLGKMLNKAAKEKAPQYPYLTNINVRWGAFDVSQVNTMFFSDREKRKFELRHGDILVCEGGEIGRCAVWDGSLTPCYYQKALHRLRPKGPILPRYFQAYMEYISGTNILADFTSRTSIAHLTREKLVELPVLLPPIPEQRKIADILQTWDEAIEQLETETTLKETAHSGHVKRLVHDPQYSRQRLRPHLQHALNRNAEQKIERVLSVTNSAGFVLAEDQFAHRVASADLSHYKIVQCGQYAYNPARINVGSIARLDRWTDGVLSPMYVVFQVKPSLDSDFFYHWLFSAEARQRIRLAAQGSVRETVSFDDLGSIPLPVPSLDRQRAVARFLNASQREIELLRRLTQKYQRQKRGLMQKLLTEEWQVRAESEPCEAIGRNVGRIAFR